MNWVSNIGKIRFINRRKRFPAQAVVESVAHDADDLVPVAVLRVESKAASQRILIWEEPTCEKFIDDYCVRIWANVAPLPS